MLDILFVWCIESLIIPIADNACGLQLTIHIFVIKY